MKTLYKTVALILLAPFVAGAAMFIGGFIALIALIGALYDASTIAKPPAPTDT